MVVENTVIWLHHQHSGVRLLVGRCARRKWKAIRNKPLAQQGEVPRWQEIDTGDARRRIKVLRVMTENFSTKIKMLNHLCKK